MGTESSTQRADPRRPRPLGGPVTEPDQLRADNAWLRDQLAKAENVARLYHERSFSVEAEVARQQAQVRSTGFLDVLKRILGIG